MKQFSILGIYCLLLLCLAASCKKGSVLIAPPNHTVKNTPPTDSAVKSIDSLPDDNIDNELTWAIERTNQEENTYRLDSVDLSSINFEPSKEPLTINSIATGDLINDILNKDTLSNEGWTHPSVLFFANGWNGYKYWMAITPYPKGRNQYENPHIFTSQDGKNWNTPFGLENPIEGTPTPFKRVQGYNSDVNLLMKGDTLICYWRANYVNVNNDNNVRCIYCKTTVDGINWSAKRLISVWNAVKLDVIAPSIIKDSETYYCYGVNKYETTAGTYYTTNAIRRMQSNSPFNFVADITKGYDLINIAGRPWGEGQEPWHIEARKMDNLWFLLVTTTPNGGSGSGGYLYLGYSTDGINFNFNDHPLGKVKNTYKSSIVIHKLAEKNKLVVELWRTSSLNWQIFYDRFTLSAKFSKK
ncbi:hypothetical protein [Arachidicoccus soli]|uniref:Exo-alpha-sialidase n=1 Tax=Arachidicoccus soli TaxID=2341117 RepID=A0A386HPV6_9BACT|nr:hypothetical protein [Arachidicoccus soli]AYD47977.1 hypothetical protein D6B99_10470 [Arachidicoccus soli]